MHAQEGEIRLRTRSRIGLVSLCVLVVAFLPDFILNHRADQYCFGPPIHNWAWQWSRLFLFTMLLSLVGAIAGLIADKRKSFAVIALLLWFPLMILVALASGCW